MIYVVGVIFIQLCAIGILYLEFLVSNWVPEVNNLKLTSNSSVTGFNEVDGTPLGAGPIFTG